MEIAQQLVELTKSSGYLNCLRPFLVNLAQEGYPKPTDYKTNEKLLLDYTQKVGETEAVKKILGYLEKQQSVIDAISKKYDEEHMKEYKI